MSDCPAVGWSPDEDPATDNPWVCVREAGHEGRHSTGLARDADGDEDEDEPVRWSDGSSNLMAERDALAAQVEALTAQRDEAVRLLRGARPAYGNLTPRAWQRACTDLLNRVDQ